MNYECSDELATLLENLRSSQKAFFAAKYGSNDKFIALAESKRCER